MAGTALRGRLTWQAATVTALTRETAPVVTIVLDPPDWPGHRATAEDAYSAELSYSIASAPGEPLAITVERLEDGQLSPYLTGELRAGDELEHASSTCGAVRPVAEQVVYAKVSSHPTGLGHERARARLNGAKPASRPVSKARSGNPPDPLVQTPLKDRYWLATRPGEGRAIRGTGGR